MNASVQTNVNPPLHIRAHVRIDTQTKVLEFIMALCDGKITDHFDLENFEATQ